MRSTGPLLVVNAGSSSLKLSLFDHQGISLWHEERSWPAAASLDHTEALTAVLDAWLPEALAPWHHQLDLVGHRVVHGGERFRAPTCLSPEVLGCLESLVPLAPLHNGPALVAMRWMRRWNPDLPQWACFDTAFHATIPVEAHTYALPIGWRRQGLRRFGFHGLNHQHISEQVNQRSPEFIPPDRGEPLRLISCHLGAGCSLCAIRGRESIATTMGFTPLEGLVMATRSGSVDPGLLLYQLQQGMDPEELDHTLNSESGLLGLSELSADMRTLRAEGLAGHSGARLAIDVFRHRLLQGIGAMAASLNGVDVIALTGGIGEHDDALMAELAAALAWLPPFSLIRIPADEEGLIARSCRAASLKGMVPMPRSDA